MKKLFSILLVAFAMTAMVACDKDDEATSIVFNITLDGQNYALKPFVQWGASQADVENFMQENYPDWDDQNAGTLVYAEAMGRWSKVYVKGNLNVIYFFADAEGNNLEFSAYCYYGTSGLDAICAEVVRNGFVYKGELRYPYYDAQVCYMYLSPDGALEIQAAGWEAGNWCLDFQPTDPDDFQYLVAE